MGTALHISELDLIAHLIAHLIDPSGGIRAPHSCPLMFSLEKLKVYDKALASAASLAQHSCSWDKRHAVADHLLRASESVVLNLAEGARLRSAGKRQHVLDYAIGSALECAASLDVASLKQLLCGELATASAMSEPTP